MHTEKENKDKENDLLYVIIAMLSIILILSIFQVYKLSTLSSGLGTIQSTTATGTSVDLSGVLPKGVPNIYGKELGISFDDISSDNPQKADATIRKLGVFDNSIPITGEVLERYVKITGRISCEYCCGAASIIFTENKGKYKAGDAACGCAHSYAMRGLAKYLLTKHANEFTDDQVLEELGKWKTLFFPEPMAEKAKALKENKIEFNYINLASNKYRGIEAQSASSSAGGSGMVGGC